jgi:antitoxin PrlF
MATLTVSSKGQIVLPADVRRRLGMGAGAKLEILEDADGLRLRVINAVNIADLTHLAGMAKARTRGVARSLEDFDPASVLRRPRKP